MTMSKAHQKVEQGKIDQEEKERDEARRVELEKNTVYFFAPASRYKVGNWTEEVKGSNGQITKPESSLGFEDNFFITDDPKKIEHIRNCYGSQTGHVKEFKNIADAIDCRTMHLVNVKGQRMVTSDASTLDPTRPRS